MRFKIYIVTFFLFHILVSFSQQTITGKVTENNQPVPYANVLIKKINSDLIIQYTNTNEEGNYSLFFNVDVDSIVVEANSFNYESSQKIIYIGKEKKITSLDFELSPKTTLLKEVLIRDKLKHASVKKDTIVFDPNKYKDGTERVVEDLLKKLPGVKVEDNGEIKFRGKSIKKLLLDGDDLFDYQYSIGSKNINVEILDKVEVIEDYNENSLLKGIKQSDDVALNLKLKKGKTDYSGNSTIGYGIENRYETKVTGLLINNKTKAFGISSYNNIGINNSPYDFQSEILLVESINESDLLAKELIKQGSFFSNLDNKFHRINNNFFSSINTLFKINKKLILKSNFSFYNDKLIRQNNSSTDFLANNESFSYTTSESLTKSPKIFNGGFQLLSNKNKNLNWEYVGKINIQNIEYSSNSINNNILQNNQVSTNSFFTKHSFNLTKKIDDSKALISSVLFSKSQAPQNYNLTPGISIDPAENIISNLQRSRFDKSNLYFKVELIGKINKLKYNLKLGYSSINNNYNSDLTYVNENGVIVNNSDFKNNTNYKYYFPFAESTLVYSMEKISFKFGLGSQYFNLQLDDKIRNKNTNSNNLVLTPLIKVLYKFSNKSNILTSYTYNKILPDEDNLFEGIVLNGYRNFQNNEVTLDFVKTHSFSINYSYNDFINLNNFSVAFFYNKKENNYFSNTLINTYSSITSKFLANIGNQDLSLNFSGEKYLDFIKTTFHMDTNFSLSFDKDIINNSEVRDVESRNLYFELIARKKLMKKVFLENILTYNNSTYLTETDKNSFNSFKESFKSVYKLDDNVKASFTLHCIIPDLSIKNSYTFIDTEITFTSKNKKIDYSIVGRNLTNNKTFETTFITDFSKTVSSHNLINRYILASVSFKF
ncbi:carboxypeptidase-like regulatory domain-containing protein [Flavobacterium sp.]|uniref:carboxypeptidase-like regulatory domain-containing protein n=1 Tax=Flavobacterium sp. TaxID=239 RepID=UPI003751B4E7